MSILFGEDVRVHIYIDSNYIDQIRTIDGK